MLPESRSWGCLVGSRAMGRGCSVNVGMWRESMGSWNLKRDAATDCHLAWEHGNYTSDGKILE